MRQQINAAEAAVKAGVKHIAYTSIVSPYPDTDHAAAIPNSHYWTETTIDASGVDWTKVVFHCFTEGEPEIGELMKRGAQGSLTGVVTYKSAGNVRAAARVQGLGRTMVETDAPYLTPMPHRGKPNEPAYVRHTAEFAAKEVFGVTFEEFAATTTATARRFFGI